MQERALAEVAMRRDQDDVLREVVVIRERRLARIVAGAVGIAGTGLLVAALLNREGRDPAGPAWALAFAVLASILAYPALRVGLRLARPFTAKRALTIYALRRLEPWSIELPLVALALLAPLALHAVVWAVFSVAGATPIGPAVAELSDWIVWSAVIVGHAHLALAACAVQFARTLRRSTSEQVFALRAVRRAWLHVAITTGVAAVPGVVLLGLPPLIVLMTGAAFVPLAYYWTCVVILAERTEIEVRHARCIDAVIGIDDLENARHALHAGANVEALARRA